MKKELTEEEIQEKIDAFERNKTPPSARVLYLTPSNLVNLMETTAPEEYERYASIAEERGVSLEEYVRKELLNGTSSVSGVRLKLLEV